MNFLPKLGLGGQRQHLAIARAFLRNAPLLTLGEPTSALDPGTEAELVQSWQEVMEGRTTFVIAHRPTTVRSCDVLLRLEDGEP